MSDYMREKRTRPETFSVDREFSVERERKKLLLQANQRRRNGRAMLVVFVYQRKMRQMSVGNGWVWMRTRDPGTSDNGAYTLDRA